MHKEYMLLSCIYFTLMVPLQLLCTVLEHSLQTWTCRLSYIICCCSFHMPLTRLITSSATISSPARLLHQPMLCLRFSAYQTVHGNSDGGHRVCAPSAYVMSKDLIIPTAHGNTDGEHWVCAPSAYVMLEVLSIRSAHGNSDGKHGVPHFLCTRPIG